MLQNATTLRKSAPGPPNISDQHVSCTAPATKNASLQILFKCPTPAIVFGNATRPSRFAHFWQGAQSLAPATRNDIRTSKSGVNICCVFNILTWKCASRHNSVNFFDIATSKSGPELVCFVHFDLEMCFAPQRRALFRHLNFQKWSEREVFLAFSLAINVLRATTACTFSTSQLPKWSGAGVFCAYWLGNVLRATTACNFSFLARWLRTRRSSELTFRPCGATNHWENTSVSRLSYLFAHLHLLSSDSFSSLIFSLLLFSSLFFCSTSAFHLSILSEVWLLNFLRQTT